jgi:hypothetical protein
VLFPLLIVFPVSRLLADRVISPLPTGFLETFEGIRSAVLIVLPVVATVFSPDFTVPT